MRTRGIVRAVLPAALVLVTGSFGCEQSPDKEQRKSLDDGPAQVRDLLGTLSIDPEPKDREKAVGHWIYVDRRIVARRPRASDDPASLEPFELLVVPGDYTVWIVVTNAHSEPDFINFPLEYRVYKVSVNAGETTTVQADVRRSWDMTQPGWYSGTKLVRVAEGTTWEQWIEKVVEGVEGAWKRYQENPDARVMNDAYVALQQSPPLRPVVYLDFPEGARGHAAEYDAEQVRLITGWLKRDTWCWFRPLDKKFLEQMPRATREKLDQVKAQVARYQGAIDRLNDIAKNLEQVKE